MLPKIEIFQKPAQGVAVTWADEAEPAFVVPFPRQTLLGAFANGVESILFIGSRLDLAGDSAGATLFARFDRQRGCVVLRGEIENFRAESASVSRDGRSAFIWGLGGIVIVDAASLTLLRRIELYRFTAEAGWATSWDELDGRGPETYSQDDGGRRERAGLAGWHSFMIQFGFQVSETADGTLMHVERWTKPVVRGSDEQQQCLQLVDWRQGQATRRVFRS